MNKEVNNLDETVYLDNAATTFPKSEAVYVAMDNANRNCCVNAGRGSYRLARTANEIIEDVKIRMKQLVKAPSKAGVVLSPSITVALNQILHGIDFKQNDIVYISPYEHNAVARTLKKISDIKKIVIKLMPTDKQSQEIDLNLLRDMMNQDNPKCVCCTHVSNVTGYILPIKEIFTIAKEVGAITILDSAQSLGLIDVTMDNIDFLAFAGHKTLYGPFGVGGFVDNSNIKLEQFIVGGRMQTKLDDLGYHEFASRIKAQKEKELNNVEEIRSRQTLREDYKKYFQDSKVDRFTTYMNICALLKSGVELQERVDKYRNSLGKDSEELVSKLAEKIDELNRAKDRINQDMTDIWDDLFEVKSSEDVEDLLDRIAMVLQKGISSADQTDFTELQENLQELLKDINSIKDATQSRNAFVEISEQMKVKYAKSEFDFEVLPILEEVICEISKVLDAKENEWKEHNLSLGDKSRASVHKWKEKTEFLPEYLSIETLNKVKEIEKEADNIISEGKMEDVVFYFEKLDDVERKKCIKILKTMLEEMH